MPPTGNLETNKEKVNNNLKEKERKGIDSQKVGLRVQ